MTTTTRYVSATPSGETFVAQWDDEGNMVAIAGSLYYGDVTQANLDQDDWDWHTIDMVEQPENLSDAEWAAMDNDEKFFPRGYQVKESPYPGDRE